MWDFILDFADFYADLIFFIFAGKIIKAIKLPQAMKEKIIVIGGGVGPMAGVELHKRIIENTLTDGTDQSHFGVIHLSRSHDVPDRTGFLLHGKGENPAFGMLRTMQMAKSLEGNEIVAGIPCNTFHAPVIWNKFLELLGKNGMKINVLHMLSETASFIHEIAPKAKTIGVMSTTGTRAAMVYNQVLGPHGFRIMGVPENVQNELHDSIYNTRWGIKAVSPVTAKARENFIRYAKMLADEGAEAIILGCTEIPIALPEKELYGIPLIDPMVALARALIKDANPKKLKML